jgi:putative FmdB family regulatory protein
MLDEPATAASCDRAGERGEADLENRSTKGASTGPIGGPTLFSSGRVSAMASYEFECHACGERFQVNVAMSEHESLKANPPICPKCGKHESRQLVSLFTCKTPSGY